MFEYMQKPEGKINRNNVLSKRYNKSDAVEHHSYGSNMFGYIRENNIRSQNPVVQRMFLFGEKKDMLNNDLVSDDEVVKDAEIFESSIATLQGKLTSRLKMENGKFSKSAIRSYIKDLIKTEEPLVPLGRYHTIKYRPYSVGSKYISVAVFENEKDFQNYLIEYIAFQEEDGYYPTEEEEEEKENALKSDEENEFDMGKRSLTIFSYASLYGLSNPNTKKQGPHTLAHVSVNFLIKNAQKGYDFNKQVLSPGDIREVLKDLGMLNEKNAKIKRYLSDYDQKYQQLQLHLNGKKAEKVTELLRDLMEMHPMAVYDWISRMKTSPSKETERTSYSAAKNKGERYGPVLFLDWRHDNDKKDKLLKKYLKLRIGMVTDDDSYLDNAAEHLMDVNNEAHTVDISDILKNQ